MLSFAATADDAASDVINVKKLFFIIGSREIYNPHDEYSERKPEYRGLRVCTEAVDRSTQCPF
ncbi:hypothetical protein [Paraburkholderia sp. BL6669N2]|uniref:hypothetical protein n=1 Tax=Paraburkholderia sp. BL6669N2 TaxID=1938807 RepID=UPI0015F253FC|nr:hypothetical protein [Paraburkholderia sp. BL6669N2]